ncbi:MAG: SulP family inorganic anion transporter [Thermoanaerobaculales bacterium]|nr:SulP family inorganic anion transporter [Thermoanaerobaculales bacterium]
MMRTADIVERWYAEALVRPVEILRSYKTVRLRPDLLAGLTVAVVAIPQSIAYASIAGLPPSYGLYAAAVAAIIGSLWGSSRFLNTGPTNAISILVLSILSPLAVIGSAEYLMAASLMAVIVGVFCIVFGFLGLGVLINFASRAVLLGFTAGAGVLIAAGQLKNLLHLDVPRSPHLWVSLGGVFSRLNESHLPSLLLGLGTLVAMAAIARAAPRLPAALMALTGAGLVVAIAGADRLGVAVVGEIAREMPRMTSFSIGWMWEHDLVGALITGSLAVAAMGLVEAVSIAREISRQSGERLDINQELVGQGMANVATGLFSGYACSGSFTRSAINYQSGARTQLSGVFCGVFVLVGVLAFGPAAAYLPKTALAGMIMVIAYRMVDWKGVRRVIRTSRSETGIMVSTFAATLVFPLEFAVLAGVILSLAIYIYKSSLPTVHTVVPDPTFRHFVERADAPCCPQLGVINIRGAVFFGAASHVEDELLANFERNPGQDHLLLRMHGVHQCDLSGIDVLEGIVRLYRDGGGDVFLVQVRPEVRRIMRASGFEELLGEDNILVQEDAVEWLFENRIDPAVCIYECEHRVFAECQPLEKHPYDIRLPSFPKRFHYPERQLTVPEFEDALRVHRKDGLLVDVREEGEYARGHLAGAELLPLRHIIEDAEQLPRDRHLMLICRSGRRSTRAMHWLIGLGFEDVVNLKGGLLSWKATGRPVEVD